ncbi:probable RNA-binding protein CG14230 [Planococcus citri]|uniref:probable RNA-binding protein CG14230 n=1 Tax=Planococcus citri TaxID=170843 RepID=UPI0031F79BC2
MGDRRLFVGNLPKDVSEPALENLFNKYKVSKIDIKRKKVLDDEAVFAFVNISSDNVDKCLSELRNKKLNNCTLKIEPAKESFLERLKKEHHEKYQSNNKSSAPTTYNSFQLRQNFNGTKNKKIIFGDDDENPAPQSTIEETENIPHKRYKSNDQSTSNSFQLRQSFSEVKNKKIVFGDGNFEDSTTSKPAAETAEDVPRQRNLPMFRGTASVSVNDTKPKDKSAAVKSKLPQENVNIHISANNANTAMRKFEEFSDVWKDDFTSSNYEIRKISFKEKPKSTEKEDAQSPSFQNTSSDKHNERNLITEETNEKVWPNKKYPERKLFNGEKKEKTIAWKTMNRTNEHSTENSSKETPQWRVTNTEDDRFKMDEKFFDANDTSISDEKRKRKKSVHDSLENEMKNDSVAKEVFEHRQLVRYDPTRPDHKILEKNVEKKDTSIPDAKKKKTKKKQEKHQSEYDKKSEPVAKPEVSKEKHYSVADTLKDAFKKTESQSGFSLSSLFDQKIKEDTSSLPIRDIDSGKTISEDNYHAENIPQEYSDDESEEDVEMETPIDIPSTSASEKVLGKCGVWGETFFFKENDSRFKEAIDFFKPEDENKVTDFDKQRNKLRSIVRKKLQNSKKDNKLFKQKLGGKLNKSKFKMRLKKARNY